jgi:phosphatidylethanolamine/phosphatidyl-N-methylethanolamine N-methyltransferase
MKKRITSFCRPFFSAPKRIGRKLATGKMFKAGKVLFSSSPVLFTRALIANPRAVGAACPSSQRLAHAIAEQVKLPCEGLVVELGGGTGAVTAALLLRGVDPSQLVVVEQNKLMAQHLKIRFKGVSVIQGNAVKFCELCNRYNRQVATVVSSLPMLSLPTSVVDALGREFQKMLKNEGSLIQYTYRINKGPSPLSAYMERISTKAVWGNFPPARVEIFQARR